MPQLVEVRRQLSQKEGRSVHRVDFSHPTQVFLRTEPSHLPLDSVSVYFCIIVDQASLEFLLTKAAFNS